MASEIRLAPYPWRKVFWTCLVLTNICTGIGLKTDGAVALTAFWIGMVFLCAMILTGARYNDRTWKS